YDLVTGEVTVRTPFEVAKHINPVYSPDGRSLFFISNPDGFNDIYRLDLAAGGAVSRVTNVATGVAGITDLAPAMSVAKDNGRLMFSLFEAQDYAVYALEAGETAGTPVGAGGVAAARPPPAALLPPTEALSRSVVDEYLADAGTGLPPTGDFPDRAYRPRLSLDYVSQPTVGGVYDPSYGGSCVGSAGGGSLLISAPLPDTVRGVALAANGTLRDIGGQALSLNPGNRLNYGGLVGRIPYLQAFVGVSPEPLQTPDGPQDY